MSDQQLLALMKIKRPKWYAEYCQAMDECNATGGNPFYVQRQFAAEYRQYLEEKHYC